MRTCSRLFKNSVGTYFWKYEEKDDGIRKHRVFLNSHDVYGNLIHEEIYYLKQGNKWIKEKKNEN